MLTSAIVIPLSFRRSQNWIGKPGCTLIDASYITPPPQEMLSCLNHFEQFLHEDELPPLIQIALAHHQFEAIHPFLDGNGRVGRLLITLFLVERKILPTPLLYLSAFFEVTRNDYYQHLKDVSEKSDWEPWCEYFLSGVASQAEDALKRTEKINSLLSNWKQKTVTLSLKTPFLLIDFLAANPFITAKKVAKDLKIVFTTSQRAIQKLEKLKIFKEISRNKRDRIYCAKAILDILSVDKMK